jgi:hypothetical protein
VGIEEDILCKFTYVLAFGDWDFLSYLWLISNQYPCPPFALWTIKIPKAQPSQYKGPFPASVNGGRPSNQFRGKDLPSGLFVCGDHMATATLNGAVESGVAAGSAAAKGVSVTSKAKELA